MTCGRPRATDGPRRRCWWVTACSSTSAPCVPGGGHRKVLWRNDDARATYGTPAATRIGDVDVVVTPKGQIVRVVDGKTLATDLGNCMYTSPVVQDRVVYFIDGGMSRYSSPRRPRRGSSARSCGRWSWPESSSLRR